MYNITLCASEFWQDSIMVLIFYHLLLQQNNALMMSLYMHLLFIGERGKYHCHESALPVTKKERGEKGENPSALGWKTDACIFPSSFSPPPPHHHPSSNHAPRHAPNHALCGLPVVPDPNPTPPIRGPVELHHTAAIVRHNKCVLWNWKLRMFLRSIVILLPGTSPMTPSEKLWPKTDPRWDPLWDSPCKIVKSVKKKVKSILSKTAIELSKEHQHRRARTCMLCPYGGF